MRTLIATIILSVIAGAGAGGQTTGMSYEQLAAKAQRFYDGREWGTSGAIYGIMLDSRGNTPGIYGRAIVAAEMMGDTARVAQLLHQSMVNGVGFDSTFMAVRQSALYAGEAQVYPMFLEQARDKYPYLSRQINLHLLQYYDSHNDGGAIIDYARRMLEGIPDNTTYLTLLARGYVLQGKMRDALDTWLKILEIDPADRNALLCAGNYYHLSGDNASAAPYLERALELYPTPYLRKLVQSMR